MTKRTLFNEKVLHFQTEKINRSFKYNLKSLYSNLCKAIISCKLNDLNKYDITHTRFLKITFDNSC